MIIAIDWAIGVDIALTTFSLHKVGKGFLVEGDEERYQPQL